MRGRPDTRAGAEDAVDADAEARVLAEHALAIFEKTLGREHPYVVRPLVTLAEFALDDGRVPDAIAGAERALALAEMQHVEPDVAERARAVLARAEEAR